MTKGTAYYSIEGQTYDASALSLPPSGRMFRNAWAAPKDGVIAVDMARARALHREALRREREAAFKPHDAMVHQTEVPIMLGTATQAQKDACVAAETERQKLRDLPADPRIEAAETPDALAALTLDALLRP